MIDARAPPIGIDFAHVGMKASAQLSSFSARMTLRADGTVRSVSADRLVDEAKTPPYHFARIEIDPDDLIGIGTDIELVPAVPAGVLIVTGERTMENISCNR